MPFSRKDTKPLNNEIHASLADLWQTTLRPYTFCAREGDFFSRFGRVYDDRNDCALYVVSGDGVDTVGSGVQILTGGTIPIAFLTLRPGVRQQWRV